MIFIQNQSDEFPVRSKKGCSGDLKYCLANHDRGLMFRSGMPAFFSRFFFQINFSLAAVTVALTHSHFKTFLQKLGQHAGHTRPKKWGKVGTWTNSWIKMMS